MKKAAPTGSMQAVGKDDKQAASRAGMTDERMASQTAASSDASMARTRAASRAGMTDERRVDVWAET